MSKTLTGYVTQIHSAKTCGTRRVKIHFPEAELCNRDLVIDSEKLQLDDELKVTFVKTPGEVKP